MMEDEGIKYIKLIYNCSIEGYTTDIEYIDQDSEKPLTIKFNVKHQDIIMGLDMYSLSVYCDSW